MWVSEAEQRQREKSRKEVIQKGVEELFHCQRQSGSRWELFCTESSWWLVASGEQRATEWYVQILEIWRCGKLNSWSLSKFHQGEPKNSQDGDHYNNEAQREQERKEEFWWLQKKDTVGLNQSIWLQKKDTVGLNQSIWSPGKPVDKISSPVPSVWAGCHTHASLLKSNCTNVSHLCKTLQIKNMSSAFDNTSYVLFTVLWHYNLYKYSKQYYCGTVALMENSKCAPVCQTGSLVNWVQSVRFF